MKIIISYPPFESLSGTPLLGQNRQYQVFSSPTYIYPVVPASAATLLKKAGHEVIWNDCIAMGWTYARFLDFIKKEKPDIIAFETKTPVVQFHWKIISDLKKMSEGAWKLKTVLFGDHVTALPEESMRESVVDYVLTGGDYDFLLLNLCESFKRAPQEQTGYFEPGIYYRVKTDIKNSGKFILNHDLDAEPFIDRDLTRWDLYALKNGNFKRTPGTYIMSGRDCWYHECKFCSWPTLYPQFRCRSPHNVLDEIGQLIEKYAVREIMDDTGTFPIGDWLKIFCEGVVKRGFNRKVYLDCNMRFGVLKLEDYQMMKNANFRLLLFGLESASQSTLDRLKKGVKVQQVIEGCRMARKAGLFPHITIMFGYPWETFEDACKTLKLGRWLLDKGYAYTMQATMVIPYPGSPLFRECDEQKLLLTKDWEAYDMKHPVMKTSLTDIQIKNMVQGMYNAAFSPAYILKRISSVRDLDDLKYIGRTVGKVLGHLIDFKKNN